MTRSYPRDARGRFVASPAPDAAAPTLVYPTAAAVHARRRGALLHWPAPRHRAADALLSACGGQRLARDGGRPPGEVPDTTRCSARGCAQRWARVDGTPSLFTDLTSDPGSATLPESSSCPMSGRTGDK